LALNVTSDPLLRVSVTSMTHVPKSYSKEESMYRFGLLLPVLLVACDSTSAVAPVPLTVEIVRPPCEHPAALLGEFDPQAPRYIVVYRDSVDAEAETARLAAKYEFQPRFVYTHVPGGFSAELTPPVVADVRCEAKVDNMEFDQRITIEG